MSVQFIPTRAAGLRRLAEFLPQAGRSYAEARNFDVPGHDNVSRLSPYLRHRLITETEMLRDVLAAHGPDMAGKFIAEIFWRTYFKGWLELRPTVWQDYRVSLKAALNRVQTEQGLRLKWQEACHGRTGIACFDHWATELTTTGYLHNHARMWFASIWIFTLELPWQLGADFFLRHLLDGDPASNTLGWRWVAGLHTQGKHYVATPENIAKFTHGRFRPTGLAVDPAPLAGSGNPAPAQLVPPPPVDVHLRTGLLLIEDDLSPNLDGTPVVAAAALDSIAARSPLAMAKAPVTFTKGALRDALTRVPAPTDGILTPDQTADWVARHDLQQIVHPYAPTGPVADTLAALSLSVPIIPIQAGYDARAWPHATHGFFRFKKVIPDLLAALG